MSYLLISMSAYICMSMMAVVASGVVIVSVCVLSVQSQEYSSGEVLAAGATT